MTRSTFDKFQEPINKIKPTIAFPNIARSSIEIAQNDVPERDKKIKMPKTVPNKVGQKKPPTHVDSYPKRIFPYGITSHARSEARVTCPGEKHRWARTKKSLEPLSRAFPLGPRIIDSRSSRPNCSPTGETIRVRRVGSYISRRALSLFAPRAENTGQSGVQRLVHFSAFRRRCGCGELVGN